MASYSQASCTLATIRDVKAVYTYYLLASSTVDPGAAPKDGINVPGASTIRITYEGINYDWSLTEPTLDIEDDIIQTAVGQLYYIECAEFTDNSYDWGPMMTSSTYAAAKAAYNLSAQAKQATELLGGHFIYKSTSSGQSTPAGAGVIQTIDDNPANWGYNTWIGSNGIQLRRGETADATLSTNGLILSKGGIESGHLSSGNGYVYLSTEDKTGIKINGHTPGTNDPKWRAIIGSKFGVDSEGNLYASNANIQGILTAGAGSTIGPWTVSNNAIYNPSTKSSINSDSVDGVYIGTDGIALGQGTFKVSSAGVLNATGARISGNLAATDGFSVAQDNKTLTSITTSGMIVYDGNGSNDSNIVAKFTSNGAQIGKNVNTFTEINPSAIVFKNGSATLLTIDQNSFNATVGGKSEAFKVSFAENKPEKISYSFNCDNNDPLNIKLDIPTDRVFSISINFKIDGYSDSNFFNLQRSDFQLIPPSSTSESYTPGGIYPNSWAVSYESRRGWNGEQLPSCEVSATYEYNFNNHILTITPSSTNVTISDYDVVISWQEGVNNNCDEVYLVLGNRSSVGSNGLFSGSFGQNLIASGNYSFAQGDSCVASGTGAYACGRATIASGECSHAEGIATKAGLGGHAEGKNTDARGGYAHAEGRYTIATGVGSHAEGNGSNAYGNFSHAEGNGSIASGENSHAEGNGTIAAKDNQTVIGKYNVADTETVAEKQKAFIIGNGSFGSLSNALTVDWSGNVDAAGTLRAKTEQIAPTITSITPSTASVHTYRVRRFGNVVMVILSVRNTASVAVGSMVFQATLGNVPLPPWRVTSACYFGYANLMAQLDEDGVVTLRNTWTQAVTIGSTNFATFSFTYIVD